MKINKTGTSYEFVIEGAIGEGSTIFAQDVRDATRIVMNAEKMTYINSIGVKNWILWTVRIPKSCAFILTKAPLVMINQASTVVGFMPPSGQVESFNAPFVCPQCDTEKMVLLTAGKDYHYATADKPSRLNLPTINCAKCAVPLEPDFVEAKVFAFLDLKS
ncbi:MAG: hypothetical protein KF799_15195 [Bdellovibrionales bacterium]|nr:hypothetical protein [Bdellovibrionales bacterium]